MSNREFVSLILLCLVAVAAGLGLICYGGDARSIELFAAGGTLTLVGLFGFITLANTTV